MFIFAEICIILSKVVDSMAYVALEVVAIAGSLFTRDSVCSFYRLFLGKNRVVRLNLFLCSLKNDLCINLGCTFDLGSKSLDSSLRFSSLGALRST